MGPHNKCKFFIVCFLLSYILFYFIFSENGGSSIHGDFSCSYCFELFLVKNAIDRKPQAFCQKGHIFCQLCCSKLKKCPKQGCNNPVTVFMDNELVESLNKAWHILRKDLPKILAEEILFVHKDPVAHGNSSKVYSCKWKTFNVALKKLKGIEKEKNNILIEAGIGIKLQHPNIVRLYGLTELKNNHLGIVMEWADQGTLRDGMTEMSFSKKIQVSLNVCDGLAYLHYNKIAHRDLKPENILLFGEQKIAKISDFGTSKVVETLQFNTREIGTPIYTAPELFGKNICFGVSVDVYSLNAILFELFSGLCPFPGDMKKVWGAKMAGEKPEIPPGFPLLLINLIDRGWEKNHTERPTISEYALALKQMNG